MDSYENSITSAAPSGVVAVCATELVVIAIYRTQPMTGELHKEIEHADAQCTIHWYKVDRMKSRRRHTMVNA